MDMMTDIIDPLALICLLAGSNKVTDTSGIRIPLRELANFMGHGTQFPENASIHSYSFALHFQTCFLSECNRQCTIMNTSRSQRVYETA